MISSRTPRRWFTNQNDSQGHTILSHAGTTAVRDLINDCIRTGTVPPNMQIRVCSNYQLDSRFELPDDDLQGLRCARVFEVIFYGTPEDLFHTTILFVAIDKPGRDRISATIDEWLAPVARIEHKLFDASCVSDELSTAHGRKELLSPPNAKVAARDLHSVEREGNAACDVVRAVVNNPRNWHPIGLGAALHAVAEMVALEFRSPVAA